MFRGPWRGAGLGRGCGPFVLVVVSLYDLLCLDYVSPRVGAVFDGPLPVSLLPPSFGVEPRWLVWGWVRDNSVPLFPDILAGLLVGFTWLQPLAFVPVYFQLLPEV